MFIVFFLTRKTTLSHVWFVGRVWLCWLLFVKKVFFSTIVNHHFSPPLGGIFCFAFPETNIAPENGWLEYKIPFGKVTFQVRTVSFREGNWITMEKPPFWGIFVVCFPTGFEAKTFDSTPVVDSWGKKTGGDKRQSHWESQRDPIWSIDVTYIPEN